MQRAIQRQFDMRRRFFIGLTAAALLWPVIAGPAVATAEAPAAKRAPTPDAIGVSATPGQPLEAISLGTAQDPGVSSGDPADPNADPNVDPNADHKAKGPVSFRAPTVAELRGAGLRSSAFSCPGAFVSTPGESAGPGLAAALGGTACTHGGDYVGDTAPEFAPALFPGYSSPGIPCYSTGPYVHVFYGYRSTSTNRIATVGPRIRETISRIDDIFATAAAAVGAVRHVRWRMASCKVVITAVALSATLVNQQDPGGIRGYLVSNGIMSSAEKGLIFTDDGEIGCSGIAGIAEWQDDESTSSSNRNNRGGMMARVFGWCWSGVGYIDVASEVGAHELSHTLGAVGDTAPNSTARTGGRSHCTDGIDLMCYNDGGGEPRSVCADAYPPTLDCNKDDYFNPSPPAGSYLATHWNPAKNQFLASTAPASFEIPPRPKATLTSPGTSVVAGTVNSTATATAASDGSAVVQVEFWLGNTSLGSDSSAPFTAQIDTIYDGFGGYPNGAVLKLVAVAVDAQGRTGPSTAATLTVGNPKVRLTAPAAWAALPSSPVAWSAAASAWPGRTVTKVELLDGGTLIATDTTAPYGGSVALADGGHVLRARVTDNGGVVRDSVDRAVVRRAVGPTVTLISPSPFESVAAGAGQQQRLAATAIPEPGSMITNVAFKVGAMVVSNDTTAPYEFVWTSGSTPGTSYDITAVATDSMLRTGTSDVATITTSDPQAASIVVTTPVNDASASGVKSVTVNSTLPAGPDWQIDEIDISVDGSILAQLLLPLTTTETTTIDLGGMVGRHVLRATLNASNTTTFASVAVSSMGTILLIPGGISLLHPTNGAILTGNVPVTGAVSGVDPFAVAPLYAVLGQDVTVAFLDAPALSDTFSSADFEDGTTTMQLTDSGFGLVSTPIGVTLKNATVKMTAPRAGFTVGGPVTLAATATADGGNLVEQVRWYVDGVAVAIDSSAPYARSWGLSGLPNGTHVLRADAILTDGRTLSSANQNIIIKVGAVTRLAGADRYGTAVAISKASFAPGVPVAYIATGTSFPDALAGAAVAGHVGGPVLLVPGTSIPATVAAELTRLKPARITILGGTSVVSNGVMAGMRAYTNGIITRLAGADRYGTAVAISKASFAPGVPVAYIATGTSFPDALAGAAVAGHVGGPVLLVPGTSIPATVAAELTRLKPARITILGGTSVVSNGVMAGMRAYTNGIITRLAGADRYGTAVAISKASFAPGVPVAYIATGTSFPDALAGAAVAGHVGGPVLLVPGTSIPATVAAELTRLKPARIVVLGGTSVVSDGVKVALAAYVGP